MRMMKQREKIILFSSFPLMESIRYIVEMFSGIMAVNLGYTMLNILLYVQTEKLGPWNV